MYVSNLSFNVVEEDLRGFFSDYGEVISAKIITDKETGRSRGIGFVEMSDDDAANKAKTELNGAMVEGRAMSITVSTREDKNSGGFGGKSTRRPSNGNSRW